MNILFIINELGNGGRERRLVQLIRELNSYSGVRMMVALTRDEIEYKDIYETAADIRFMENGTLSKRCREIRKLFEGFRPDIVHLWVETAMFCVVVPLLARRFGCKYVAGFVADGNKLDRLPRYQRIAIKFTFRRADAIISNSKAGLIAKGANLSKSHIIYNGFDSKRLVSIDVDIKRKELGTDRKYLVVMCGRMEPAKDWDSFILMAENVSKARDDVYFLGVAGRGAMVEHYRTMIRGKNLSNVHFVTCRSDVMEIFAASDVSVLFTNNDVHAEGVSNSIMESMAAGVPVIATAGGGTAEIISSGQNGFIIEPKNVEEACARLFELLDNNSLRQQMSAMASKTISTRFVLSSMATSYMNIYNRMLAK